MLITKIIKFLMIFAFCHCAWIFWDAHKMWIRWRSTSDSKFNEIHFHNIIVFYPYFRCNSINLFCGWNIYIYMVYGYSLFWDNKINQHYQNLNDKFILCWIVEFEQKKIMSKMHASFIDICIVTVKHIYNCKLLLE